MHSKILIVDDDFEDRMIMAHVFNEIGCEIVKILEDSESLFGVLGSAPDDSVKLIVLDLNMPRIGGKEILKKLKSDSNFRHIPVFIFSTSLNEAEWTICKDLGAEDFITKPLRYADYIVICKRFHEIASK